MNASSPQDVLVHSRRAVRRCAGVWACVLAAGLCLAAASHSRADELRNIKTGQAMPQISVATIDGGRVESSAMKGSVVVLVYLSAEQRSSELAATESQTVVRALKDSGVTLIHITADEQGKDYFTKFRKEHSIDAPLGIDADRAAYHAMGLIVFPTTVVIDKEGKLAHTIALRGLDYSRTLDTYIRHAQGALTAEQVQERLTATTPTESSPRSLASAHRAAAKLHREKGRLDAAREELMKARELDPTDREAQLDIAEVDMSASKLDDADKTIEDVLKSQPEHRRAKLLKGICLYKRGNLSEAEQMLTDSLRLNPDPSRAHYYLGRLYEKQGSTVKALEHYREALRRTMHEFDDVPEGSTH